MDKHNLICNFILDYKPIGIEDRVQLVLDMTKDFIKRFNGGEQIPYVELSNYENFSIDWEMKYGYLSPNKGFNEDRHVMIICSKILRYFMYMDMANRMRLILKDSKNYE